MINTSPAQRLTNPAHFGRRPDAQTISAESMEEKVLNEVALWQHSEALAALDRISTAHCSIFDLAELLNVGPDQLRRKLYGKAKASLTDVLSWGVAAKALSEGVRCELPVVEPVLVSCAAPTTPQTPDNLESWLGKVWQGDCLPLMNAMPANSVDLILADLPYGTTRNSWDSLIPLTSLWESYEHILKPGGCVVLTSAQPFTAALVMSKPDWFRYEWIWSKTIGSGQLNAKKQPMRTHESVLVFAPKAPPYFPQMGVGTPYKMTRKVSSWTGRGFNEQSDHKAVNTGTRYPKSVLLVPNPRIKGGHPTQKPVALFEYLIETYTLPGQVVLDNVMGSGTTAEAARNTGRKWIGMELDVDFASQANKRVSAE